jgi:myo-inositol-1-phosphate synthase
LASKRATSGPRTRAARTGVWLIGARGAISSCVSYGLAGMAHGLIAPTGIATEREPLARLALAPLGELVLGGCDVVRRGLDVTVAELARQGILPRELVAACAAEAAAFDARVTPGVLDGPDVGGADLDPRAAQLGAVPPREQIAAVQRDLAEFARAHDLGRAVVVNLASTEAFREPDRAWNDLGSLERALDAGRAQPASIVYAYAALAAGHPFVNFTPNRGASIGALRELALARGVPHCGNDGKTGETLLKATLGPMFAARALRVLSWQGYNMLGNRDGAVLADPAHRQAKLRNKDEALRSILGPGELHTHVGIDFVPSLGDWKTAMDFVHFEGFLGARMSLQLTWHGSDSALAAPLVLDLARLAAFAAERGESGEMAHTACYFKAPIAGGSHAFAEQWRTLERYAAERVR